MNVFLSAYTIVDVFAKHLTRHWVSNNETKQSFCFYEAFI